MICACGHDRNYHDDRRTFDGDPVYIDCRAWNCPCQLFRST